jgi:hypothetical protein
VRNVWFQQNGATAYTARQSTTFQMGMFPGRLILRFGDIPWPARSPDLTAPDFFMWRYLKSKVYATRPHSIEELKDHITEGIGTINGALLQRVMQKFRQRFECHEGHLEEEIFKK